MDVRVLPPGSLAKNPNNPHQKKTAEQRRQRMLATLLGSLARIQAKGRTEVVPENEVTRAEPHQTT